MLWLNKANQEIDSEHVPIMNQLYKFYNKKASSIRGIMVANCPWMDDTNDDRDEAMADDGQYNSKAVPKDDERKQTGNPLSHHKIVPAGPSSPIAGCSSDIDMPNDRITDSNDGTRSIHYSEEFRKDFDDFTAEDRLDDDEDEDDDDSQMCKS